MIDFTALVASKEWEPLIEAGAIAMRTAMKSQGVILLPWDQEHLKAKVHWLEQTRAAITAYLENEIEVGRARLDVLDCDPPSYTLILSLEPSK